MGRTLVHKPDPTFPEQIFFEYLRKESAGIVVTNRHEKLYFLELGV
jgi:hypothetical protein